MRKAAGIAGLLAAICIAGCGGSSGQPVAQQFHSGASKENSSTADIEFQQIDADSYSGVTVANVVIQDASAWAALWREHKKSWSPAPALPSIDFAQQTVLGVFMGDRNTGGYDIRIRRIHAENGTVFVEYTETSPPAGAVVTLSFTAPSQIVVIPRTSLPITFVKTS